MRDWDDALRRISAGEDVKQVCDDVARAQTERVRDLLRSEGRDDLVDKLDANLRNEALGISGAQRTWHSVSAAQRRVLLLLSLGKTRTLVPAPASQTRFGLVGGGMDAIRDVCGRLTVRALHSRSLIEPTVKNVFHYTLTERGRFVIKHGQIGITAAL